MKIRGYIPKKKEPEKPNLIGDIGSVAGLVQDLNRYKDDLIQTKEDSIQAVAQKIQEAQQVIDDTKQAKDTSIQDVKDTIQEFKETAVGLIRDIHNIPQIEGKPGDDGKDADEDKIIRTVIEQSQDPIIKAVSDKLPSADEMVKKVISLIPENKASLKIIKETFETDPMAIIDKIMAMPDGKFKLKTTHIDGLEQTIRAFHSQLGRGYLHGGGISNITGLVLAGTNVTITGNGTQTSPYVINSTGGGSSITLKTNGVNNGSQSTLNLKQGSNVTITDDGLGGITINSTASGSVQSVTGLNTDNTDPANPIVKISVDGSSITGLGTPGSPLVATGGTTNAYAETPSGTINSSNVTFTLAHTPADTDGVLVLLDGVTQYNGIDYTVSGSTITFSVAPTTGSTIFAYYNTFSATGGVSSIASADGSITVTGTTSVDLAVVKAPKLTTARTINGTSFDGTANITVTAAAGTLTGTTLNSTVVTSSLTSVGTLGSLTVTGNILNSALTASKVVFTDGSKNLTSTGIGTSAQFIKGDGSLDSNTYITGNQTITLSGHVTGSGTTAITTSSASKFILQGTTDTTVSAAQFLGALGTGIVKNTTTTGVLSIAVAADFPTLNQNTSGSAASLTTPRTIGTITGDATSAGSTFDGTANNTNALTLATVNANTGSWGTATQVGQFTVNAKGLITAAANVTVTPAVGSITGLGTGVATALAVNVGSAGAFVTFNGALGTPSSGTGTNITGITAAHVVAGTFGTGAYTMDTSLSIPQIFDTVNTVTASANAITITRANRDNKVTNNSAAGLTITLSTSGAVDGDKILISSFAFSAVAQTITWVNTEVSDITPSANLNASTTSPRTDGYRFNGATSKWRCIGSC